MELTEHVESIRQQFAAAAEAGGDEAKAQAERLFAPLESAIRLALQDVLVAAAEEITCELAPASVELRLRGREPEFVVNFPQPESPSEEEDVHVSGLASPEGDEGATARINLRLPEHLKARVDEAAANEGLSINTWMIRDKHGSGAKQLGSSPRPTATNWISAIHRLEPVDRREQMTVFQTPEPISVSLEFGIGDLRLVASDSTETVVEVGPSDPTKEGDVNAANQTRVEYASGSLLVRGPKNWRQWTPWCGRESIDVEIRLPAGSRVCADVAVASVRGTGRFGELDIKTGMGDVRIDEAGPVKIRTGFGEVMVGRVEGDADVKSGSGRIDIGSVRGTATVKNSNGDTRIGEVEGRAQLQNANGAIHVDSARSDLTAKTALGDVRLGLLSHGATEAKTACGQIDIGVLDGVAAWLDLSTGFGRVNNDLENTDRPPAKERTTEIRAHTAAGDINIRRVPARAEMGTR